MSLYGVDTFDRCKCKNQCSPVNLKLMYIEQWIYYWHYDMINVLCRYSVLVWPAVFSFLALSVIWLKTHKCWKNHFVRCVWIFDHFLFSYKFTFKHMIRLLYFFTLEICTWLRLNMVNKAQYGVKYCSDTVNMSELTKPGIYAYNIKTTKLMHASKYG